MTHRGISYNIMQGITRGAWKWSFETRGKTRAGSLQGERDSAIILVQGKIDMWLRTHREMPEPQFT